MGCTGNIDPLVAGLSFESNAILASEETLAIVQGLTAGLSGADGAEIYTDSLNKNNKR